MAIQQIPNLVQGVSQQSPQQRRDTQCEAQFDCINSVVDGVVARPPTEVVKVWASRDLSGAFLEEFVRGGESYLVGIHNESPLAINLSTGVDATIGGAAYPNTTDYLDEVSGVDPRDQFRMQAIEDTIFVANREATPAMDPSILSDALDEGGMIVFKPVHGAFAALRIYLTGPGTATGIFDEDASPDTGVPLANLVGDLNGVGGYTCTQTSAILVITRADGAAFNINTSDDSSDQCLIVVKDFVSSFDRLPFRSPLANFRIKVAGEDKTLVDDYWVQYVGSGSSGAWQEVVAPDTETTIDPETMPHTLVNTGENAFSWVKKDWSTRVAGDGVNTAKNPSFIGKKIRDLFYHKSRFGILLEAGAVWSKARNPFTFFPDTVQTELATAPVDVTMAASSTIGRGTVVLDFPVQVDKTMNFWGQGLQFEVTSGQDNFKQESISADPTTAYEYSPNSRPYALGKFLYFPTEAGPTASLYAIQYQQSKAGVEVDVTQHVKKYIPAGVRRLTGSTVFGLIFVQTDGEQDALYLWNFLYSDGQYLQSSWNKWRIPGGDILWSGVSGNVLRILQQRPEGVALLHVNLTTQVVDDITGAEYLTRLDMRVTQAQVTSLSYNSGAGTTSFTLPYTPTGPDLKVVVAETSGSLYRGTSLPVVSVVGAVVTVTGDLSGGKKFYAGQVITAERTESEFFHRTDKGVTPFDSLTLHRYGVQVSSAGYTRIEVTAGNTGITKNYEFNGRTAGLPYSVLGPPSLGKGQLDAPIDLPSRITTIRIVNDSFLPSGWQSAYYDFTGVGLKGKV